MTGPIEDIALRFEGLDDTDIVSLNAALPDIQHLITVLKAELPRINRLAPIVLRIAGKIIAKQIALAPGQPT